MHNHLHVILIVIDTCRGIACCALTVQNILIYKILVGAVREPPLKTNITICKRNYYEHIIINVGATRWVALE